MNRKIKLVKTDFNGLALWECGGTSNRSGFSLIICGPNGEKLLPHFVHKVKINFRNHVLLPIDIGCFVIETYRGTRIVTKISKIVNIEEKGSSRSIRESIETKDVLLPKDAKIIIHRGVEYWQYRIPIKYWLGELIQVNSSPSFLDDAIQASIHKATKDFRHSFSRDPNERTHCTTAL